ncbi:hypothetical protein K493DRAFT_202209 [Basidiobolus meristosporus CBS 931.73]|uniref:Non-canonical E2 ubiquitin-conjugating enzyme C-terminal domain-containing protein n=1 Tax=Basidiobolus meristosporus CBS 931.73 TaxID=1314790 RepID=A0A1Y1ZAN5_9FUNG|nr:hypothetical protein K493DRAFT_202209 [Basidiobolus meristosporus CBS 931.73]|eukprot:ORY07331.1 hypothetical protein K493DRAFT_202209 [Basidiobolus meristosporus CBS 931.73]
MLTRILDQQDPEEDVGLRVSDQEEPSRDAGEGSGVTGLCIECGDTPSIQRCLQCQDEFCELCFSSLHRTGTRRSHQVQPFQASPKAPREDVVMKGEEAESKDVEVKRKRSLTGTSVFNKSLNKETNSSGAVMDSAWFEERSKYIPLRLELKERKLLRLLEASLNVSEYTDKVDVYSYESKTKRMVAQIRDICAILSGLVVASDYKEGQRLVQDRDFPENAEFFQTIFEIGRRYKIMNPARMRSAFGKLMYLLQDSAIPQVKDMLHFSCVKEITTVHAFLESTKALDMLEDDQINMATKEIIADGKSRSQIQSEIKQKERAIEYLSRRYSNDQVGSEELKVCLYSIGDNHSFLRTNRDPCDKMIHYLTTHFRPDYAEPLYDLSIMAGRGGARLTHSHQHQYQFVLQSLILWREIQYDMFKLWYLSEQDMLDEKNPYRLRNTGQGLNRVQPAPRVSKAMRQIVSKVQREIGHWVGSSVVHLGDDLVPSSFHFIDKYTQVPRILNPIVACLDRIDELVRNPELNSYLEETWGGADALRKEILADFFRYAFDGSGGANFFEAGSCIDGRLTSCWNWCSQIEKKPFFPVFLLTGFMGFDGEF